MTPIGLVLEFEVGMRWVFKAVLSLKPWTIYGSFSNWCSSSVGETLQFASGWLVFSKLYICLNAFEWAATVPELGYELRFHHIGLEVSFVAAPLSMGHFQHIHMQMQQLSSFFNQHTIQLSYANFIPNTGGEYSFEPILLF